MVNRVTLTETKPTVEEVIRLYASKPHATNRVFVLEDPPSFKCYITEVDGTALLWFDYEGGLAEDADLSAHPDYESAVEALIEKMERHYLEMYGCGPYRTVRGRDNRGRIIGFCIGEHEDLYISEEVRLGEVYRDS